MNPRRWHSGEGMTVGEGRCEGLGRGGAVLHSHHDDGYMNLHV